MSIQKHYALYDDTVDDAGLLQYTGAGQFH